MKCINEVGLAVWMEHDAVRYSRLMQCVALTAVLLVCVQSVCLIFGFVNLSVSQPPVNLP
jgi:hypothetical protein